MDGNKFVRVSDFVANLQAQKDFWISVMEKSKKDEQVVTVEKIALSLKHQLQFWDERCEKTNGISRCFMEKDNFVENLRIQLNFWGRREHTDIITVPDVIQCLETQLQHWKEKDSSNTRPHDDENDFEISCVTKSKVVKSIEIQMEFWSPEPVEITEVSKLKRIAESTMQEGMAYDPQSKPLARENPTLESSQPEKSTEVSEVKIDAEGQKGKEDTMDIVQSKSPENITMEVFNNIEDMWAAVDRSSDREPMNLKPTKNRRGWKTIRIFVSSTFKDFYDERETLVKEIFPDLRLWCEERKLRLVECDLRWGVPKDTSSEDTVDICLSELDRCREENTEPYFLNLVGGRIGWIPGSSDMSEHVAKMYEWIYGLSVTEMEIVNGAYRRLNPNALFMIRQMEELEDVPNEALSDYFDADELCTAKLDKLRKNIRERFPRQQHEYHVKGRYEKGRLKVKGLSGTGTTFYQTIINFFKERIQHQYPLDTSLENPLEVQRAAHEAFLDSRAQHVYGRSSQIQMMEDYYLSVDPGSPLAVVGLSGAGKSSLMARSAQKARYHAENDLIEVPNGFKRWNVFCHFVGATPGSTDLALFFQRLINELNPESKENSSKLEELIQQANNILSNENTSPTILFIDAINQFDEDKQQYLSRWLPQKLSPNIRLIVSMIEETSAHKTLRSFKPSPKEVVCNPLDQKSKKEIVLNLLKTFNKRLDSDQMARLIAKDGSSNPLWLTLACEELRVHGKFENVTEKIETLPDGLIEIEMEVFSRFESEIGGPLLKATLCLLEVSRFGLLEIELLQLLADPKNVELPPFEADSEQLVITERCEETSESNDTTKSSNSDLLTKRIAKEVEEVYIIKEENEVKTNSKDPRSTVRKRVDVVPAREWAMIYRQIKTLLRPCGHMGEGRLDFYHRSLSKAVRQMYFNGSDEYVKHAYNFWHAVLAGYFESVCDMDRKAEELPYHLEHLLDNNRLINCLLDWEVFKRLYNAEFSADLLSSWRKCGDYALATTMYTKSLEFLKDSDLAEQDYCDKMKQVAIFLGQAGQYQEAYQLMEQCVQLETTKLGARPKDLGDLFSRMGYVMSRYLETNERFISGREQLEKRKQNIDLLEKSNEYFGQLEETEFGGRVVRNKTLVLNELMWVAFYEGKRYDEYYVNKAKQLGHEAVTQSQKLGDIVNEIEGHLHQSFFKENVEEELADISKAEKLCLKALGKYHWLYFKILYWYGQAYDYAGRYEEAYDKFSLDMDVCMVLYGPNHPETDKLNVYLNRTRYVDMKKRRELTVPGNA